MEVEGAVARLIALDPRGRCIALSVAASVRVLEVNSAELLFRTDASGAIRVLCFSPCGTYLLLGGDDKNVQVVQTSEWTTVMTQTLPKKVSAGSFAHDATCVIAADRFGDVYCMPVKGEQEQTAVYSLLGHFCSIITSLIVTREGKRLITCDRDGVARLSVLPMDVHQGSYIIEHFLMGHKKFISAAALAFWNGKQMLVTGGGDGLVLFFDLGTGLKQGSFDLQSVCSEMEIDESAVVVSLSACRTKPLVAVIIENSGAIFILRLGTDDVSICNVFSLMSVTAPCHCAIDAENFLWIVGGPQATGTEESHITIFQICDDEALQLLPDARRKSLLIALESRRDRCEQPPEVMVKGSLSKALARREYSCEKREERREKRAYVRNAEYVASVKNSQADKLDRNTTNS